MLKLTQQINAKDIVNGVLERGMPLADIIGGAEANLRHTNRPGLWQAVLDEAKGRKQESECGPECTACSGATCRKCGAGLTNRGPCFHDVIDRHEGAFA